MGVSKWSWWGGNRPQAPQVFNRVNRNFVAFAGRHCSLSRVAKCEEKKLLYKSIFQSWGFSPYLITEILECFS